MIDSRGPPSNNEGMQGLPAPSGGTLRSFVVADSGRRAMVRKRTACSLSLLIGLVGAGTVRADFVNGPLVIDSQSGPASVTGTAIDSGITLQANSSFSDLTSPSTGTGIGAIVVHETFTIANCAGRWGANLPFRIDERVVHQFQQSRRRVRPGRREHLRPVARLLVQPDVEQHHERGLSPVFEREQPVLLPAQRHLYLQRIVLRQCGEQPQRGPDPRTDLGDGPTQRGPYGRHAFGPRAVVAGADGAGPRVFGKRHPDRASSR